MPGRTAAIPRIPFDHLLAFDELVALLRRLNRARPGLSRLDSVGSSPEGRDVWCLTICDLETGPPEDKPAYLIHANIHATELSGTHAALFTARQLLADHPRRPHLLERVAFYIVPRLNPDGAEFAARTSGAIRSRHDRSHVPPNTLVHADVDGDGRILQMRQRHPDGDRVVDPEDERLLVPRAAGHAPPFFRLLPEGEIRNWDGCDDFEVESRSIDWNRQWSCDWRPDPEQPGAGDFPYSEPEMHAIARFIHDRPNIFGILGYHTGPAAFLRPPSVGSDDDLDQADLQRMEQFGRVARELTGLPCVPIHRYRSKKQRPAPLHGHFPMTGYQHFGLFVFEFELGTIMDSAGMGFDDYWPLDCDDDAQDAERRLMRWYDEQPDAPPIYFPWRAFDHPQLGPVEIGGQSMTMRMNLTMGDLKKRCADTYRFTVHHAGQHPHVRLEAPTVTAVGGDVFRIRVRVANRGGLPTSVTRRGAGLSRLRRVQVTFDPGAEVEVLSCRAHHDLGHLTGPSTGRQLEWFVRAKRGSRCRLAVDGGTGGRSGVSVELGAAPGGD